MVLSLLVACAPRAPSATIAEVALTRVGLLTAEAEIRVAIDNPLPLAVPVAGLLWAVEVDGQPLLTGERPAGDVLAAGAVTVVPIPVTVRYADLLAVGVGDHASVKVSAELSLDTPAGVAVLPLSWEATVPRVDPPSVELVDTAIGLEGGDVVLGLHLLVDLPLGLEVRELGWLATFDGARLGSGEALVGGAGHLGLPIRVDPRATAHAAMVALFGRPSTLGLQVDGRLETGLGEVPIRLAKDVTLP